MKKFFSLVFALTIVACGTEQQSNTLGNETKTVTIDEGTFKLYKSADAVPEAFCDLHVSLTLKNTATGSVAVLENALVGACEIAVTANPRTYALNEVDSACGSRAFEGVLINNSKNAGNAANDIVITDHRSRTCKDIVPASIIVEKKLSEGVVQTLFSAENGVSTLVSMQGTLTRMMAIGGESTGYGLQLADGSLVEIELEADLLPSFVENQKVEIAGKYKTVRGIEIPVRQVLLVKTMTAI